MSFFELNKQLFLRSLQPSDALGLYQCVKENQIYLRRWLPWADQYTLEAAEKFIDKASGELEAQEALHLGIFLQEALVGMIDLHEIDHELKCAKLGYWLSAKCSGQGIMGQSVHALLQHLFMNMGFNKAEIHYHVENTRSANVAAKAGFSIEGLIRDGIKLHGQLSDRVVCGLLRKTFLKYSAK